MGLPLLTAASLLLLPLAAPGAPPPPPPEVNSSQTEHFVMAKILGGVDAKNKEFPYLLSLEVWGHHLCGATAVSAWWAVTAAHCVAEVESEDVLGLRAGSVRREVGGHVHCVVRVLRHPRYGDYWYDHDIALLQVSRQFSPRLVSFLRVSEQQDWPPGTAATVVGWGVTRLLLRADSADISFSDRLRKVEVRVIGNEVCRKKPVFFTIYPVTSRMLCAISPGKDSTQGDSGGPLVVQGDNGTSLVGVVSWGEGRGDPDSPGVYTRVAAFAKWIHAHSKRRRVSRGADVLRLSRCGVSAGLTGDHATHQVRVVPTARRRQQGRRRARRRPGTPGSRRG
ncbi:trypsin 3A1-like isoform X2 [Bacillus rossius redtenbacheri]|uniref:trypsin 3A1-like isoform X2 n=1 Tax=Bacillus rossius redtenbacheri TaxID=93214 RepID=UPI002FDD94F6